MLITIDTPEFRPVTIRFETQDEFDKFLAILEVVKDYKMNYNQHIVTAAKDIYRTVGVSLCSEGLQ